MEFLKLFSIASYPVIKILLLTAIGSFLALDRIDILGENARKHVNYLVFYVFNPALVSEYLAKTITLQSFISMWFLTVNTISTYVLGSALGWILIKITRPPKHMKGLILGCCSAGNLGNLLIIIIPALCEEKGSPFGEADVCYKYGMAYASLSMAVGAIFLWSYVYFIIRISSRRVEVEEEADTSDDGKSNSSGENSESLSGSCSEAQDHAEDNMDDAYTILLPSNESEEETKMPLPDKIKRCFEMISRNCNLKAMFAPSILGAIAGFIIGVIPVIRKLIIGTSAPLYVVEACASMLGDAAIPTVTLILGANLLRGLKRTGNVLWSVVGIIAVRYIFLPLLGVAVVKGAIHFGLVHSDSLYQYVLYLQYALPPAMNIGTMAQLFGAGESECSVIMLWTYALASIAVTLWSTFFLWLVS